MRSLILAMGIGLIAGAACAQAGGRMVSASSVSGQFIVHERQSFAAAQEGPAPVEVTTMGSPAFLLRPRLLRGETNAGTIVLEPPLLAVSCERIKASVLATLGLKDSWRSKIELWINHDLASADMSTLAAVHDREGTSYHLELPKEVRQQTLARAIIGALLMEIASRNDAGRTPDLPLWLVDGLSAHVMANSPPTLLLQPGLLGRDRVVLEGQSSIRRLVVDRAPLSFQQLSWPDSLKSDSDKEFYRACSQLFVEELLDLKGGRDSLREMTLQLGGALNWQTVFLRAFRPHFASLLAVEKWWGVTCIDFKKSQSTEFATAREVMREMRDTLDVPVKVRLEAQRMPSEARITLQEAIASWSVSDSDTVVQRALLRLQLQQYRAAPTLRPVVDAYLAALAQYLRDRREIERKGDTLKNAPAQIAILKRSVCKKLEDLDQQRDKMAKLQPTE